jgi:hypothetical protein
VSVEWNTLVQGLAGELANLPAGGLLVISEFGEPKLSRYAQFAQGTDELLAYVVHNSFLDEQARASEDGERVITEAGWRRPDPDQGHDNWWRDLPWPATAQEYRDVAQMVATALRDGYGIADPGVFHYQAWNEQTGQDLVLPELRLPVR